ncbi:MAG: hypothetical protein VB046_09195 [Paludibacter sp.]|jgi:hypothetical protein|nr:hypothetical protein [Paludibacter sp.]
MKIRIFTVLFLYGLFYSSYAIDKDNLFSKTSKYKGVKKVIEKTFDEWKVVSAFDKEGFILQEINYYKNEIKSSYKFDYILADTLLEIKRTNQINKNVKNQKIERFFYTTSGKCYKYRVYFLSLDNPSLLGDNFLYEDGKLVSYTEANDWQKRNDISSEIVYKYNERKQKIHQMEIKNVTDTTFYTYLYNQSGQLTDYIQESNNNEVIYSDVVPYSKNKMNKIHIKYSNFDKLGNWTRSTFITEKGKVFRSKKKIEYW